MSHGRALVFTGNRAEFGILTPLLLAAAKDFELELAVSGAHLLPPWNTVEEVEDKLDRLGLDLPLHRIPLADMADPYLGALSRIYDAAFDATHPPDRYDFAVVLGDRVEACGFTMACFMRNVPVFHFCGGDVVNVHYFDTNLRHAMSKLAHVHFPTNDVSAGVLEQMGEEPWRVRNVGHLSLDYDRLGFLPEKQTLAEELGVTREPILLITYHPDHELDASQNLAHFTTILDAVAEFDALSLVTYPNNDPGYDRILAHIDALPVSDRLKVVPTLGTERILALQKHFRTVVVGNSSLGLMETPFYRTPALNIGHRQADRLRAANVVDAPLERAAIRAALADILKDYDGLCERLEPARTFFGDGRAALKARDAMVELVGKGREALLFKKFIIRGRA